MSLSTPLTPLLALALTYGPLAAQDLPVIDHLERTTLTPSGRLSIHGSNFEQSGQVLIDGVPALVVPIQGTYPIQINAYVPEDTPFGPADVTVVTSAGTSNAVTLNVVPRAPEGRMLWRFTMNNQIMLHRPALGADGTIYAKSQGGDLVAISPDGALQWLHQLGVDWTPTIDVGLDGTIYTADGGPTIHAIHPDGTTKWTFTEPVLNQGVVAGPNVGPDGNVYVVSHSPGYGAFSLTPDGELRWVGPDNPYSPIGQDGQEIVFSDTQLFFCQNGRFDSFAFDGEHLFRNITLTQYDDSSPQPAVGPNGDSYVEYWGRLQAFDPAGSHLWTAFDVGGSYLRGVDVSPDGTIYTVRNVWSLLHALNPDGSEKWQFNPLPDTLLEPTVSPTGDTILVGAGTNDERPNYVLALGDDGAPRWQFDLPIEQYGPYVTLTVLTQGQARFTPDGSVVYVMAIGTPVPGHCYLYALQVDGAVDVGNGMSGMVAPVLGATGSLEPGTPVTFTLTGARPNANAVLFLGREAIAFPLAGGVFVPRPDNAVALQTDASGSAQYTTAWPQGMPSQAQGFAQVWLLDDAAPQGFAASNALSLIGQ